MQYAVVRLLLTVIDIYWWIVVVSFVVSWLVAFDVINTRSSTVYSIRRALAAMTEPLYEPIRRVIPTMGGLDFSPMIVLLALQFLSDLIAHSINYGSLG
jgi:YggT family protein